MTKAANAPGSETAADAIRGYFEKSAAAIAAGADDAGTVHRMAEGILATQQAGGKVLVGGNGGSCADAEHFAGELTCTFKARDRRAFAAVSLTSSASAITAWANDFGFESYFERQVQALGRPGDILFAITTGGGDRASGASMNLVKAAEAAKEIGMKVYSIAGKTGGELATMSDEFIKAKSFTTSHVQEVHIVILHAICEYLDELAGKVS